MKRYISFLFAGFLGLCFMSCEGPVGPPGENGIDGIDGTNGDAVCMECHNLDTKDAITAEWEESAHGIGAYVSYAGGRNSCAKCHSNEGFIETQETGLDTVIAYTASGSGNIPYPTAISCATCHSFHESLDFENEKNYALRVNEGVTFIAYPSVGVVDFGNSSNLCASCHQFRTAAPGDNLADANYDDVAKTYTVTSTHWGPHHGPQGNIMYGIGGYKPGVSGTDNPHLAAGCTTCHMHREGTDGKANHTFEPSVAACTACHTGATSFDINGYQTAMAALGTELKGLLVGAGAWDDAADHVVTGTYDVDVAGAVFNYITVYKEQSGSIGMHNPDYSKAMIESAIAIMKAKK